MKTHWLEDRWQRALVYGLGASGLAAARLLLSHGVEVVGVDRRNRADIDLADLEESSGCELMLGSEPEALPGNVDGVVVSPGVPLDRPLIRMAEREGIPVIAEVELAFPLLNGPVIGITGSNGKSTTTALAGSMLAASGFKVEVCGNIGVPLSDCVVGDEGRIFVTELSSFQLEGIVDFHPAAAALLNVSPDHLDRHRDMESYVSAKRRIFANQQVGDFAILNGDDREVSESTTLARRRFFSREGRVSDGCFLGDEWVLEAEPESQTTELFSIEDLKISGVHNLENAMAAALLARALGAEPEALRRGMAEFQGLPHRLQWIRTWRGIDWFNDSKATNVEATMMSLEGCAAGAVHLIAGGRDKGGDPGKLTDLVRHKAKRVYLIGEAAENFRDKWEGAAPLELCGDLESAVQSAALRAQPGEVVVLSPACASFDQYENFARRGEHFQSLVASLAE